MTKLLKLSLEELYSKEKKTAAVVAAIVEKSNFSTINKQYCQSICKLKCKSPEQVNLLDEEVDILVIEDHRNPPGKFDKTEDQQDRVQAGIIDFLATKAGFKTEKIKWKVVSLLKCKATNSDFPGGKPPTQTTLQKCFPYLDAEIKRAKPKAIISLGTAVTKSLGLTRHSNTGNRGHVALSEYGPVVITLHPRVLSYIRQNARGGGGMWGPDYFDVVKRDFEKALKIVKGEIKITSETLRESVKSLVDSGRIKTAASLEDVRSVINEINQLPEQKIIAWDTETTSIDPLDSNLKLLSIQFGWVNAQGLSVARTIPLWHRENKFYDADEAWKIVVPVLTGQRPKVSHNGKYDQLVVWWSKGVRVENNCFDTLLLQHSIESGTQGCYSLKTACWDHLLELGLAGYEDDLGDLKNLAKELDSLNDEEEENLASNVE